MNRDIDATRKNTDAEKVTSLSAFAIFLVPPNDVESSFVIYEMATTPSNPFTKAEIRCLMANHISWLMRNTPRNDTVEQIAISGIRNPQIICDFDSDTVASLFHAVSGSTTDMAMRFKLLVISFIV